MELNVTVEELRKNKLFVATPQYGGQNHGMYMKSCLDLHGLCIKYGIEIRFSFLFNESLITRARNYLVDEFLRSGYTHLLFIDSDIAFNAMDVLTLLALNKDIIGGPYSKKSINWENVKKAVVKNPNIPAGELDQIIGNFVFNPVPGTTNFNVAEPLEVLEIGTGFMMIKREVFGKFEQAYPHLKYKPDHVGQANFDGSRYIHAYFDTVIDPGSERYLSEDYMFCLPASSRVETEDGIKTMKEIVDKKYSGKVLSLNKDNKISWNKVVNWTSRKNENKTWVKINTESDNNTKAKLKCTSDHRVAYFTDIFEPSHVNYTEAKNLEGKYVVRFSDEKRKFHKENTLYNKEQMDVLIGTLLGDATISKTNQISIVHGEKQKEYLEYKTHILNGSKLRENLSIAGFGKGKITNSVYLPITEQTRYLRDKFYEKSVKTIKNVIDRVNEKSLAFWYMDDGSLNDKKCIRLSTNGFNYEDHLLMVDMFKKKWNVEPKIDKKYLTYKDEKRIYYYLRFDTKDSEILFNKISQYVPACMEYKLPENFRGGKKHVFNNQRLDYAASKVKNVVELVNFNSNLYDIEVENDHNFIANGTLVHNCQNWRNIGGQIWLCPWMETIHCGSYGFQGNLMKISQTVGSL